MTSEENATAADAVQAGRYWRRTRTLVLVLLLVWASAAFGLVYFARTLNQFTFAGWPLGYWLAAQGVPLVFLTLVLIHAWVMRRLETD